MSIIRGTIFEYVKKNDIAPTSFWPFEPGAAGEDPELTTGNLAGDGGEWTLYMEHTRGAMFIWPTAKRVPSYLNPNPVARHHDKAELLAAFQPYCTSEHGRWDDHPYRYQDHAHGFNWPTGTLAGVAIAIKVIGASLAGDRNEAWRLGKFYENKVERALDPEWWASYDAARLDAAVDLDDIQG